MTALFVVAAGAVVALLYAARSWRLSRRGRAASALDRLRALGAPGASGGPGGSHPAAAASFGHRPVRPGSALPFPFSYLNRRLARGALAVSPSTVLLVAVAGAVGCFAVASVILGPGWPADTALVGGLWAPLAWVDRLAARRRQAIAAEMERVAAAIQGGVSAGLVPYEALVEAGVATGGILGPELLRTVADADRIGLSEALLMLGRRVPLPEVHLLVAALRLGQQAGAELSASLQGLQRTLRERRETASALRAATAAGRYQAGLLVAVPPLLLGALRLLYPAFEAPLFTTATGRLLLAAASVWVVLGYAVVLRMATPREVA